MSFCWNYEVILLHYDIILQTYDVPIFFVWYHRKNWYITWDIMDLGGTKKG